MINEKEIVAYYDNCQVDYAIVWHLNSHMCMHYGYWEPETRRLRQALNLMNQRVAEQARVQPTDRVLDAGCGVGGSGIWLARNIGCKVHGITLSEKQVATARQNAIEHEVDHLLSFDRRNYLNTGLPDASFDVVWAIESVCYAYDKKDFLREAYRLLRPGGRLVVADFFSVPLQEGTPEHKLMDQWTDTWAIKAYAVGEEFHRQMGEVGFQQIQANDATQRVLPSIKRLYYAFWPGLIVTTVGEWLGLRNKLQTANTWSTYYQYKAYRQGLWQYFIFSGEKPG